jgi:hypothetical protein
MRLWGWTDAGNFDVFLQRTATLSFTRHEDDPIAGHRELQRRLVYSVALLDEGRHHRCHAGMRHQSLESKTSAGHRFLIAIAKRHANDHRRAGDRWRWIERPGSSDGVARIRAATRMNVEAVTACSAGAARGEAARQNDDGARARCQALALSPRCHAQVHCCCLAAAGGGNMW